MKKILLLSVILLVCSSFVGWPCHPKGDIGVCRHIVTTLAHAYDYDDWGNTYPCSHYVNTKAHAYDLYPCIHYCN